MIPAEPRAQRLVLSGLAAATVVVIDQVTKSVAVETLSDGPVELFWTLRLALSFNKGAAFSIGTTLTPLITVVAIGLVGGLVVFARNAPSRAFALALGLLLGGAIGNISDRLFRSHGGAVVDFIDLQWWPVFNIADVGVTIGAALLVLSGVRDERRDRRSAGDAPAA